MQIPSWLMVQVEPWHIIVTVIILAVIAVFVVLLSVRAHRLQVGAGKEELVGKTATTVEALKPRGTVFIQGEIWAATSDKGHVEPDEEVIITKVEGLKLRVTKKE